MMEQKRAKEPLLKVRGLKKYFPVYAGVLRHQVAEIKAVDGVGFDLHEGQVLGLVGESGSGKSTTARSAIRLIEPTSGEITFEGKDFLALSRSQLKDARKQIQIVFQDPFSSLNPRRSIGDSIGEPLSYHKLVKAKREEEERVVSLLEQVGLSSDVMRRFPHEFSGGQQQRICIARALALNPKIIVFDEAVSALDVSVQAQILNLLSDLKEKFDLSYLFIAHDLSVVRYLCDSVLVMHNGIVVEREETETLFENPQHPYTKKLLSAIPPDHPIGTSNQC